MATPSKEDKVIKLMVATKKWRKGGPVGGEREVAKESERVEGRE